MVEREDGGIRWHTEKREGLYYDKTPRWVSAVYRNGKVSLYDIIGNPRDFPSKRGNGVVYMTEEEFWDMVDGLFPDGRDRGA